MGESLSTKIETIEVCHALIQNPNFLRLLLQIDADLADQMHAAGCSCGGVLHRASELRQDVGLDQLVGIERRSDEATGDRLVHVLLLAHPIEDRQEALRRVLVLAAQAIHDEVDDHRNTNIKYK